MLSKLDWRFATKSFDPTRKLSSSELEKVLTAIQKAPSSSGLQPWHVYVVTDAGLREKMRAVSWNQAQVTEASHLLVFCARTDVSARIDAYVDVSAGGDPTKKLALKEFSDSRQAMFASQSPEELLSWSSRQAYLALGFGLAAAAELGIDSCPMEGFLPGKVDELLQIPSHIRSFAYLALGYRAAEPQHPKVRFSQTELFSFR